MSIKLKGSSDGSVSFDAPADTSPSGSDITLTLPTSAGSANQFLKNSGIAGELEYSSMVETSTGVGIGTSSPDALCHINKTSGTTLYRASVGSNSTIGLEIVKTGSTTQSWRIVDGQTVNGKLEFYDVTDSATRMCIDGAGNVGISTTSPARPLTNAGAISLTTGTAPQYRLNGTAADGDDDDRAIFGLATASGHFFSAAVAGDAVLRTTDGGNLLFGEGQTERMRITSGGTLFLNGQTSNPTGATTSLYTNSAGNFSEGITIKSPFASGNRFMIGFYNNANNKVGDIVYNGTSTAYNTTSDYRLKENVVAVTDGITRIKQLNPSRFNFIGNTETTVDGFLAHEVQSVVSEAVTGEHNGVDDSGNPVYQSIDQSKLVPLLTAALQEAIAKIETLETKVAALEAA